MKLHRSNSRRTRLMLVAVLAAVTGLLGAVTPAAAQSSAGPDVASGPKPTVVLVHGAFADASGWSQVIERLQRLDYPVYAPANPLRGLPGDAAYLRSFLATVPGPIVLVGHSYGGMVMTNAATGNDNVEALVYVAAFAPDEGDTVGGLATMFPGSMLVPENLTFRPYELPDGTESVDAYISIDVFREVFAADVSRRTAAVMAVSQRPSDGAAIGQPSGEPAWETIPSWFLVARNDNAIPADAQRFMAERANAVDTVEVRASHVAMISQPKAVTELIIDAARSTAG